jgi:hypothetical protein
MISQNSDPSYGLPPPPVLDLTMEQDLKLRRMTDLLPRAEKEDIITLLMALQRQNFALCNTVSNLVQQWPNHPATTPEVQWSRGTLYETKD